MVLHCCCYTISEAKNKIKKFRWCATAEFPVKSNLLPRGSFQNEGHLCWGLLRVSWSPGPPRCAVAVQLRQIRQLICCSLITADVRFRPCNSAALYLRSPSTTCHPVWFIGIRIRAQSWLKPNKTAVTVVTQPTIKLVCRLPFWGV